MDSVDNSGFKAGKAEVKLIVMNLWARKFIGVFVAVFTFAVKVQTARIRQTHGARSLVKRFARSVVTRFSDNLKLGIILNNDHMAVAAADNKAEKRRFKFTVCNVICGNMRPEMMNGNKVKPS